MDVETQINAESAESEYRRRHRLLRFAILLLASSGLLRIPTMQRITGVEGGAATAVYIAASAVVFFAAIWAYRCTLCGGGIRLNGRTCAKCGHEFKMKLGAKGPDA